MKSEKTAIQPTRNQDFPEWYQQVVRTAELAENSPVRGCMVIKPWGYSLWENIQKTLDKMLKDTGHQNAYFPLFIPLRFMQREAEHVEGFAKECAVVTHHRLEASDDGLIPAGKLEEPLIVRPTSETIIGETFAKWIQSYRDLPLLINQWANVVRWEMRTRLFIRTTEFLWQEGHTAHATREEAWDETLAILNIYKRLVEEFMAIPVLTGEKTSSERFPGAESTLALEAMMQDRKALQAGTSHFLGQNFARAANIVYQNMEGKQEFVWTTSWGVTTRLIGSMVMVHGDDNGMVVPPKLAPSHVAILPIIKDSQDKTDISAYCDEIAEKIRNLSYAGRTVEVVVDKRDMNAGEKSWGWIKKGIPIILEIGPRDMKQDAVFVARRDKTRKERYNQDKTQFINSLTRILDEMQKNLFEKALEFRQSNTHDFDDWKSFEAFFTPKNMEKPEIHGGFARAHWCANDPCEEKINTALGVTIRVVPQEEDHEKGSCIVCGEPSRSRVVFGKAY